MNVISLVGQDGGFETAALSGNGVRSFGLFNYSEPMEGDLVVIQRQNSKVLYMVVGEASSDFQGSNGNRWWTGKMVDIIKNNMLTYEMIKKLRAAGLA